MKMKQLVTVLVVILMAIGLPLASFSGKDAKVAQAPIPTISIVRIESIICKDTYALKVGMYGYDSWEDEWTTVYDEK